MRAIDRKYFETTKKDYTYIFFCDYENGEKRKIVYQCLNEYDAADVIDAFEKENAHGYGGYYILDGREMFARY